MEQRYIDKFHQKYEVNPQSGCWEWSTTVDKLGYAHIWVKTKDMLAHRFSYLIHKGDPAGMCVCHSCDNPSCVNPDHLWLGTRADNNRDKKLKGRARGKSGSTNGYSKLIEADVLAIRASTLHKKELAKRYNVSLAHIYKIQNREGWKHI